MYANLINKLRRSQQRVLQLLGFAFRHPFRILLMVRMSFWILSVTVLMKMVSFEWAIKIISPKSRRVASPIDSKINNLPYLLDALLNLKFFVFTPTCWKRACILHRYLALAGYKTRVVFGIRKDPQNKIVGHAWLEADGKPVFEKDSTNYTRTFVLNN